MEVWRESERGLGARVCLLGGGWNLGAGVWSSCFVMSFLFCCSLGSY